jgi:serine/threonine-protein kinase HipA
VPTDIKPRILTTAIDLSDGTASLKLAMQVAAYFELSQDQARKISGEVARATATWRLEAKNFGIPAAEIERMASSFEHDDLKAALAAPPSARTTSGTRSKSDRSPAR